MMVTPQHQQLRGPVPDGSQKRCTKCGELKPADTDHFLVEKRYGTLTAHCRTCGAAACRARYAAKRESILAARRTDLEAKARDNAARRQRRATDPVARETNRQRCLQYAATHRAEARERALLTAAGPGYTDADVLEKLQQQGYRCTYCGTPLKTTRGGKFHVDHFIPISRGGLNSPDNICCACPSCNRSKHDRMPFDFLADLKGVTHAR